MKILVPKDCDNAPKRRLIKDIILAYARADKEVLANYFHKDFTLKMIGKLEIVGKEKIMNYLNSIDFRKANTLEVEIIITHGKFASAMGKITYDDETIAFNNTYEFTSAGSIVLKRINSFTILI